MFAMAEAKPQGSRFVRPVRPDAGKAVRILTLRPCMALSSRIRPVALRHKNPSRVPSRGLDKDSHKDSYRTDSGIAALPED